MTQRWRTGVRATGCRARCGAVRAVGDADPGRGPQHGAAVPDADRGHPHASGAGGVFGNVPYLLRAAGHGCAGWAAEV
ncbi:hypothetical protein BT67DRAFT_440198 [Trichocladium antarcticum]|uniref:Uncharacterized protein n=1 Tax=Trichocladium antarcticum TaxID=1450529 RepID=A0AAN6ZF44_9PEZI|nr:hypothetical protein BT67DRAFT_440198 [Trichocladium antarcticum]